MFFPLISCICITRKRPQLLQRAIDCFKKQHYPNKEIVILYEDDDPATEAFLAQYVVPGDPAIKQLKVKKSAGQYLGGLRNLAIQAASGAYICQWDDDDWYHPDRLRFQYSLLEQGPYAACVMGKVIIHDSVGQQAYLSCYRHWEGTVLCQKEAALRYPYVNIEKGEDTPFIDALLKDGLLLNTLQHPHYFVYTFHGANTWDYRHFSGFFPYSKALSKTISDVVGRLYGAEGYTGTIEEMDLLFAQLNPA